MTNEFGALLRQRRQQAGLTQEALAEQAGVGVRTIRGLETGERADPRVTTVRLLADALSLRPEEHEELLGAAIGQQPADRVAGSVAGAVAGSALHDTLADAAEQLAHASAARWRREEEQRQVQDPFPLPVRWRPAPEELADHWGNIRRRPDRPPDSDADGPLDLGGRLDEIVDVYRRIPSGRLVLLGRSGSGKTILTLRFALDYLASRSRADPVPVIFSIGSWNPTTVTLRDWLAGQLTRDHPGLAAAGPGGSSLAAALVEADRVLPVLDGFDEIADGLRRPALEALNATVLPLVLTSRPGEYAAAVAETDVLTSAAAVELTDLTLDDLAGYLPRTTRKAGGTAGRGTAGAPDLAELRDHPDSPASVRLTAVLTTPLMVTLARASYSDSPARDPSTLLDTGRFGSREALEDHLLDSFVPTVYRRRTGPRRFDPDRARHWLGYLAEHLTRRGTPDLAWWQLGGGLRRPTRLLVTTLAAGLAIGLVDLVVGLTFNAFAAQLVDGTVVGILAGLMFGLVYWLAVAIRDGSVAPTAVRIRIRGRTAQPRLRVGPRLVIGLLCGLIFGSGYGFVAGVSRGLAARDGVPMTVRVGMVDGLVFGLVFGLGAGIAFALLGLLETPLDIGSAVNPPGLLRTNRTTVITRFLVWAPTFGLLVGAGVGLLVALLHHLFGPLTGTITDGFRMGTDSFRIGMLSGLGGAIGYVLALTAWGQWAILARVWLPLTGRLPWSVAAFLDDAYRRGVLRQAGAVYQFRHARLQHHLTRAYLSRRPDR